jgi:hypothetical protein
MAATVVGGYTYVSTSAITQQYVTEEACNVTTELVKKPVKIQRKIFASTISSYDSNTDPALFQVSAAVWMGYSLF